MRFIAASVIVVHHGISTFHLPGALESLNLTLAVSFFFVLSGFILAYVHPRIATRSDVVGFWRARVARCWPLQLLTLFLFAFVFPSGMGYDLEGHPRLDTFFAQFFLVQAWIPSPFFFFSFNSPAWSVSVEYFFYFCFPMILLLKQRFSSRWCLVFVLGGSFVMAAVCSILEQTLHGQSVRVWVGYINPIARLFEFVFGMCCSFFFADKIKSASPMRANIMQVLAIIVITLTFFFMQPLSAAFLAAKYLPEQVFFAFIWSFVIFSFSLNDGLLARICSHKIAVKLGEISFTIYMLHSLISNAARPFWQSIVETNNYQAFALYFLTVMVLSYLVHEFIERPARNLIMGKKNAYG